ncbi:MAG: FKBP-type peptidyl-prolyl cis-trans isomerase [Flavobacteriales bacterium]|nr:FKBP-type peptidyl-prolyl cis-trans isomerase [Flavobacteriales bacterium]MDG1440956.1 FKBP-type peptidyl-prolyl cis-trans isomerase [Flavobacteriales bacterium]MDG1798383.1 FKBP-type peptidyl-prolyl cis-trans isomerase [Flavobacteriales bacterium]
MLLTSCKKPIDYDQIDEDLIQQYITDNSLDAQPTGSGLYYVIDNPGNGSTADINSTVTVAYVGKLTDGTIFDQSSSMGTTFPLINVIQGWQEGIPLFREGGSGILLIPSSLGYGSQAVGGIPANSVLIFEISLIHVF